MRRVTLVLIIVLAVFAPLRAQDTPITLPEDCSEATVKSAVALVKTAADAMDKMVADGQTIDAIRITDIMEGLKVYVGMLRAQCDGLSFRGEGGKVIGPIQIPKGVYRAFARTEGYIIVHVNPLDGNCGQGSGSFLTAGLFSATKEEASKGTESLLTSEGCSAILEISNVQAPWLLSLEKLN